MPQKRITHYALRITHYALLLATLLLLVACGDEPAPATPIFATATAESVSPLRETPNPTNTAVTLGVPPTTPSPTTAPPTPTASQATVQNTYVRDATFIVSGVIESPEIADAISSSGDAAAAAIFGGNVDIVALGDKLEKAAGVVSDAGEKFAALDPPDSYKPTHDRLIAVFAKYDNAFTQAETAVNNGDWGSLAGAIADIVTASDELTTLMQELSAGGL